MAAESSLKNMVLCLTLTCLLCASILGVVYSVTLNPIEQASRKALTEALALVLPPDGDIDTEARTVEYEGQEYEYYVQSKDGVPTAWAVKSTVNGFGGPLTVLVGVRPDGVVNATKVLSHSETPGLGAKCQTDEHFIGQFEGFDTNTSKLMVRKDGGDVDAITASTITSRAYTLAVANAVAVVASVAGTTSSEVALNLGRATSEEVVSATGEAPATTDEAAGQNNNGGQDNE